MVVDANAADADSTPPKTLPGSIVLEVGPLIQWPPALAQRLSAPVNPSNPDSSEGNSQVLHLLGYADPAAGLVSALANDASDDIAGLLNEWHQGCVHLLQRWRDQPGSHRLINLSRLNEAAAAELLRGLGLPDDAIALTPQAAEAAPETLPELPAAVAHYLAQREDVVQLYADLEGCAELLGRQPEPAPAAIATRERGLDLAGQLLEEWQQLRSQQQRSRLERKECRIRLEEISDLQRQTEAENEARLRDLEEERELVLLQLKQVQDELIHTFEEKGRLQEHAKDMERRLQTLEGECRYLFQHSRLNPEIDRSRVGTILDLVRETLQL